MLWDYNFILKVDEPYFKLSTLCALSFSGAQCKTKLLLYQENSKIRLPLMFCAFSSNGAQN